MDEKTGAGSLRRVLYVVVPLPGDDAPTKHAFAIADLLGRCGCSCEFLTTGIVGRGMERRTSVPPFPVTTPGSLKLGKARIVAKYIERLTSARAIKAFDEAFARIKPHVVIYYGISRELASHIVKRCAEAGVPSVVDETDWFDYRFNGNIANYIMERSRSRRVTDIDGDADGVIAISPFFENYFRGVQNENHGRPAVLFLPPLNSEGESLREGSILGRVEKGLTRFVYAGSLGGRKDRLVPFIRAVESYAGSCGSLPRLDVVGVDEERAQKLLGHLPKRDAVVFHGRLPHEEVLALVRSADFGVLLRHPERYARAGFSTKFAECMSNGVPMFCNEVGGADSIIDNGKDGILIPDCSDVAIADGLGKVCRMADNELASMKGAALEKALILFEADRYVGGMSTFLDAIVCNARVCRAEGLA